MSQTLVASAETVQYSTWKDETELNEIMLLIEKDLSEPYSIFTYRYFIRTWPDLCIIARKSKIMVGVIVGKLDVHKSHGQLRGYIAMLAVDKNCRQQGIGSTLVNKVGQTLKTKGAQEIVLETELSNKGALKLYENLGFFRAKYLKRYYMNGMDAYRLKLILNS